MRENHLSKKKADVQARRDVFYQKRRDGLAMWEAGFAAGLSDGGTIKRYERWWQEIGRHEPGGEDST